MGRRSWGEEDKPIGHHSAHTKRPEVHSLPTTQAWPRQGSAAHPMATLRCRQSFVGRKQPTPPAISERGWPGEQEEYGNRSETAAITSQVHGWRSFYSTHCAMQAPRRSRLQTEGATSRLHTVALNSGAWMTDEARRRRRPWRTAALNVGAWITREHVKRHWAGKRHLSMLEPGRQPHCRLAAPL